MEIITSALNKNQLENFINKIIFFFQKNDIKKILIQYGWSCNCDIDEQYQNIEINIKDINKFINKIQKNNIFQIGKSDLYIFEPENKFEFLFCHESDIHFKTTSKKLIQEIKKDWEKMGYKPYYAKNLK